MLTGEMLRRAAAQDPARTALIGERESMTYAEFDRAADRLANALNALQLGDRAKVAIMSTNCPAYAVLYFGIARTPCVSAHLSTRMVAAELAHVLQKVEAKLLFLESRFLPQVTAALGDLRQPPDLVVIDACPDEALPPGAVRLASFVAGAGADAMPEPFSDEHPLAITLTGGTTGFPKAVVVSHKARYATVVAAAHDFGLTAGDVVMASTPLFHTAGLFVWFVTAVMSGATIVFPPAWNVPRFMALVQKHGVTAAFLVPSQLADLVSHPEFAAERLGTLKNIGYAGAPMGRSLFTRIRDALPHVRFTENYGQSEACPITIRTPGSGDDKFGSVGRAAVNAEIGIFDRDGNLLPVGEIGDIATRGEQLFTEYFNDPEETAAAFRLGDGWLLTGDVGFVDDDGYLTLVDRSKDMLVSGGENVYPAEIENALYAHAAVAECAVFGVPDERWGEVPAAHVVLQPGADVTAEELMDFCAARIARFKRPRVIEFADALPRTPVGKIRKNVLRDPYWKNRRRKI